MDMQRIIVGLAACALTLGLATVATAQRRTAPQQHVTAPPIVRIGGGDVRGLKPVALQSADIDVDLAGSFARTTYTLTLHNPNGRLLEGTLEFPLAAGQQVTGFALDIDGQMREAVPVPKETGRQVFESIERRQVDPALLEQTAGNHFRLRVYPIPANGTRTVRLSFDDTLRREGADGVLDLALQGFAGAAQPMLHVRGVRAAPRASGRFEALRFARGEGAWNAMVPRDATTAAPLALRVPIARQATHAAGLHEGTRYVLAEVPLAARIPRARAIPHSVGLLWDASASARKRDRDAEFALLDRYFRAMGEGRVTLRFLRDVGEDGGRFDIRGGDWSALRNALATAVYDGATDLSDWQAQANIGEYLLVTDGLHDYGDGALPRLGDAQRLYALSTAGADADATRLAAIAQRRNGRLIAWRGQAGVDGAARALLQEGVRIVAIRAQGATDVEVPSRFVDDGMLRVAARVTEPSAFVRVTLSDEGMLRDVEVPLPADDATHPQVAGRWAHWRIAGLSAEPERHRAEIARIGQSFGLVTAGTSLLVLDSAADYVRYDIPAPPALRAEVEAQRQVERVDRERNRSEHLDEVASRFETRLAWWQRDFPKDSPRKPEPEARKASAAALQERERDAAAREEPPVVFDEPAPADMPSAPAPAAAAVAPAEASALDRITVEAERPGNESAARASITLQPWEPDAPYARRLRDASPAEVYALYLDERDGHADSTAFYLDVADILMKKNRRAEALRVLSNLAEMRLANRHVLRVLGYRLMQAGESGRAVQVFSQVREMADEEPQSHRDLGLALAAAGRRQEAIERLYEVVARPWDARFDEVDAVALNELNAIVATSPVPLDTGFIDRRLQRNMPLDLRAVLAWDSDNSDMDLWVTDPNGEKCYYANQHTYQGGLLSDDFTGGYGPEEFLLRDAKPGQYRVEAHYFGDRQQIVTGGTTLTLRLSTGWGTGRQKDQTVTLRLVGQNESVLVGEFEVQ
jgi:tetratricopeptide (TPR) repeat protein